jgi:putative chitinase
MLLTLDQLSACTGARIDRAQAFLPHLTEAMRTYDISTKARIAAFLPNVGHESGGLKYTREVWGPTPAQSGYEGRRDLGNTQPGDGRRFSGGGLLQTTGRATYVALRTRLRSRFPPLQVPDFEAEPEKLSELRWAALSAGDFWDMKKLNTFADADDFLGVCVRINGRNRATGLPNGWEDRQRLHAVALNVLEGCE